MDKSAREVFALAFIELAKPIFSTKGQLRNPHPQMKRVAKALWRMQYQYDFDPETLHIGPELERLDLATKCWDVSGRSYFVFANEEGIMEGEHQRKSQVGLGRRYRRAEREAKEHRARVKSSLDRVLPEHADTLARLAKTDISTPPTSSKR